jgi:hypothetical protein
MFRNNMYRGRYLLKENRSLSTDGIDIVTKTNSTDLIAAMERSGIHKLCI